MSNKVDAFFSVAGLVIAFAGAAMIVSSCNDRKGELKEEYAAAAACTEKLKRNEACTLEEQKAKEAVTKNQMKSKDGEIWFWLGTGLIK